jgi:hypothetical protein
MKVNIGNVTKNIPKEYYPAVGLLTESDHDNPDKIRLSPWERFLYAEAAWRMRRNSAMREYLFPFKPVGAHIQYNRKGDHRYVVEYENSGVTAIAIVPTAVLRACPNDKLSEKAFHFD